MTTRAAVGAVVVAAVLAGCGGPVGSADAGPPKDGGTTGGGAGGGGGGGGGADAGGGGGGQEAGPGCRTHSNCPSGLCTAAGDCVNCVADLECSVGKRCGTGTCLPSCSTSAPCPQGWSCEAGTCVDFQRDPRHCGSGPTVCEADAFCAGGSCWPAVLASVCALPIATVLLDGQPADDTGGQAMGAALVTACAPNVATRTAGQTDAGVLSVRNGQPLALGELLVVAGGSFRQEAVRWFEATNAAPVRDSSTSTHAIYALRDGGVVSSVPSSVLNAARDRLLLQFARTPAGPVVLNASGNYAEGTRAAATYFVDTLLPARASQTSSWIVLDWNDLDLDGVGDPNEFTVIASGN